MRDKAAIDGGNKGDIAALGKRQENRGTLADRWAFS